MPLLAHGALAADAATTPAATTTSTADATQPRFDHLTTGFELIGQHRDLPCESCHNNAVFKGTPSDCAACHGLGIHGVRATTKPVSHIMSSNRCEACHTPVAWNPAVNFDHAEVLGSCSSCHNGVQAQGKGPGHIDTSLECDVCHSTMGWAGAIFNHVGIVTGCAACHNGVASKGMPPTHIPVDATPCEACHIPTQYTSFSGAGMNHAAVSPPMACANCHEAGMSFFGVTVVTRPPAPHPTSQDCGVCHLSTTSFSSGTLQPAGHIPTTQTCTLCHSNPNDYSVYVMRHDGIASGCASCHAPGLSFTNLAPPALVEPPANHVASGAAPCESCHSNTNFQAGGFAFGNISGASPPAMVHAAVAGMSCETCHAQGMSWAGTPSTVVEPTDHIPVGTTACVNCHAPAVFTSFVIPNAVPPMNHSGFTDNCSTCHGAGKSDVGKVPKLTVTLPPNHVPIGPTPCEGCHSNSNFNGFTFSNASGTAPPAMVHSLVGSMACSSCHEAGMSWIGAPLTVVRPMTKSDGSAHVAVGECSTCHFDTVSFKGATDLPSNHIPLPAGAASNCSSCHANLANFALYTMDHSVVTAETCASCHATGLSFANMASPVLVQPPANHIAFGTAACESCHSNSNFATGGFRFTNASGTAPPSMVHAAVAGTACATCHAAGLSFVGAPATKVLPATHVPVGTAACESCHTASNFTSFVFTNASGTAPPAMVHSLVASAACSTCHEAGSSWIGAPPTVMRPATKADGTAHVITGECSTCHFNTTSFKGATDLPSNHIPLPAADNSCSLCHSNPSDYSVATMSHANITSNCAQCHGVGMSFANMAPPVLVVPPANHISFGTAACESCHSNSNFATGGFKFTNASGTAPPAMVHAAVAGMACATCHAAGLSFAGTPATKTAPVNHVPVSTAACESCHAASNFTSFVFANASGMAPPSMIHSAVGGAACSGCHEKGMSWIGAPPTVIRPATKADGTAHTATGECSTCHFNTTSFKGATDLPSNHIPLPAADGNNCALCHANPSDYSLATMSHANITSNCAQCHGAGMSFANMAPPVLVLPPANHIAFGGAACESCHSNSNFAPGGFKFTNASGTAPPAMVHAAVPGVACATCHASGLSFVGAPATKVLPATHVPVGTAACESCHTASNFTSFSFANSTGTAPPAMVHSIVSGSVCSACHEAGRSWIGAPPTIVRPATKADGTAHVITGECSTCHFNTTSFKGATDLPSNHIPLPAADNNCALCHSNPNDYSVATMSHANISSNCAQCHAAGKNFINMAPPTLVQPPADHIAFGTATCESCHSNSNFATGGFRFTNASGTAPPAMVHAAVAGTACATCHAAGLSFAGTPATKTVPANHVPVGTAACESCHAASNFTSFVFANDSGTAPPAMVHSLVSSTTCSTCHEAGNSWIGAPVTVLRPALKADGTVHVAAGECSTCHFNTSSFKGATDLPSNHIPLPSADNNNCALCHSNPGDYSVATMSHANITSNCAQCHAAGKSFANMAPPTLVQPPANHVASGAATCEACHSNASFATGGFRFTNASGNTPPAMVHAAVPGMACASCHAAGLSFAGTPATRTVPVNHVPIGTADCESCHAAGNFSTFMFANASGIAPPSMIHSVAASTACSGCHEKGMSWIGAPPTVLRPATKADGTAHTATGECSTCHFNTTSFKGATDLPSNHIPLPAADGNNCALCHSNPNDYSVATMSHANITSNCAQCHGAGMSFANMAPPVLVLPPANHIAFGTAACESCHAAGNFTAFSFTNASGTAPPAMVHAAVAGLACAACHASGLSFAGTPATKTVPANHVPVGTAACESCHTPGNFTSFLFTNASGTAPPAMVHSQVSSTTCSTCHEAGNSWIGTPATLLRPATKANGTAHVAAGECSTCHLNTSSFKGATDLPSDHIPLPAADNNNCALCHSNPNDYSVATMSHANITSNCAQCHAAGKSFANMAPPVLVLPPANHIAFGAAACESCHANSSFATGGFRFTNASGNAPPAMVHAAVPGVACATCHASGLTFAGVPVTRTLPATHVPVGAVACESCHAPGNFSSFTFANATGTAPPAMVHSFVSGTACSSCHESGHSWIGAPATVLRPALKADGTAHVATGECSTCHFNTTSFKGATDLPSNHIPLPAADNNNCALCHTNPADYTLSTMNHVNIGNGCAVCHAAGKSFANMAPPTLVQPPANHVAFGAAACEACHSSTSFAIGGFKFTNASGTAPPAMVHAAVAGAACATCHAAGLSFVGAPATKVLPATHVPVGTAACESCHAASNFTSFSFTNASGAAPPAMVHSLVASTSCSTCHEAGNSWIGTPATLLRPATKADGTAHVAAGECSTCHFNTTSFKGATDLPSNHIPLPAADNNNCALCHSNPNDYSVATMSHANITNSCASCHAAGKSFANMAPPVLVLPPANHIAFGAAACESCHSKSNFTTGGFRFTNASGTAPPAMVHAAVPGVACATCHAAGLTFAGTPSTKTLPPSHVSIGSAACESCHAPGNFTTFAFTNASGTAPPAMVHAAIPGVACSTCHATGLTFIGTPATRTIPSNHVPVGTVPCEGCHAPANFTAFSFSNASGTAPPAMVHSLVSSTTCSACHEAGRSWVGSPVTVVRPALKANGTAHVAAGECSTCHFNTTSFKGATDLPANHLPLPAADNNNCALCHSNPGNYSVAAMNHVNIASGCASCHAAGKSFANMAPPILVQPPANHVPFGGAACESCHSKSNFATGGFKFSNASGTAPPAMVHAAVSGMACASCHASGLTFAGTPSTKTLPSNHVPIGAAACEKCHAPSNFTTFVFSNASATSPPAMVHSAVAGVACATCHAAGKSFVGAPATRTLPSNHVPVGSAACESCHAPANFTSFVFANASGTAPSAMVHSVVSSTSCSTCHEAGKSWAGTPATLLRPARKADGSAHVAAGECSTCHFNTTSFKGATDLPANHIPLPSGDGNNCVLCHTTAGNYSLATMNHVNISSNCAQCHAYGLSFANIAAPALVQPPSGSTGHIPSNPPNGTATIACEQCHLATVFTTFAGTVMKHAAVKAMTCMSCHEIGMKWKTNTGVRLWVRDSANHYAGKDCGGSGCHSTRDKFAARRAAASKTGQNGGTANAAKPAFSGAAGLAGAAGFNHQRAAGASCISCHGQASGMGKPPNHIHSSDRCESCHMTMAWLPVTRVDHLQLSGTCISCHDSVTARGKSRDHIASGANCEACHTTNAWTPARFDHAAMPAGTCRNCHDSVHATGKPANHVPTTAQCDSCHGTLGWKPALLDHSKLTASCASCHDNNIALGVPASHMNTQRDCATCHSYPDWTPLHFVHAAAAWPGQHKAALECSACHTSNAEQVPWSSPADAGSCGGCHARNFRADRHPKTNAGATYTASELRDCSGACHVYSDATLAHVAKPMPGPYHRVTDSSFKH